MKRLLALAFLLAACSVALSQSTVTVIGPVTPGNCAGFFSTTQIRDSGIGCGGGGGAVSGPAMSTVGDIATWNNTTGTLLADTPVLGIAHGGTNGSAASGTLLDNITAFGSTGMMARTGAGTYAFRTITGSAPIVVANGDGVAGAPAVSCATCGDVVGPASATSGHIATFNGTSGKLIQDGGAPATGTVTSFTIAPGNGILATGTCTITTGGTCTIADDIATNTNFWAGTANKIVDAHVAQTSLAVTALTVSTTTFTADLSLGLNFSVTLLTSSCSCTMASPTNVFAGASGFIELIQPASGGPATITSWGGNWKFAGGVKPTLSTGANAKDIIPYFCDATNFCMVGAIQLAFQ